MKQKWSSKSQNLKAGVKSVCVVCELVVPPPAQGPYLLTADRVPIGSEGFCVESDVKNI